MRAVSDAKQSFPTPFFQTIDLHGKQFDFRPVVQLRDAVFQEWRKRNNLAMKSGESAFFGRLDPALWNHETGLKIIVAIKQNQQLPVAKKTEQLFRIAFAFRNTHPKDVDRHSEFVDLESRALVCDRVTPVGADDEIGINVTLAFGRFRPRTGNAVAFEKKIDNFVLHLKGE